MIALETETIENTTGLNRKRKKVTFKAFTVIVRISAIILSLTAISLPVSSSSATTNIEITAGVDVRLRYDGTENLPTSSRGESTATEYARIRIRPWIKASHENMSFLLRPSDEFRHYRTPDSMSSKQRWPDVLFIDSMYFEWTDALDSDVDFKIGRQDIEMGAGRIISDGSGGDGSRSSFFDAVRMIWNADENRSLEIFGLYQASDDWLPTLGKEHANGEEPDDYDLTGYGQDEFGAGIYWQDRSCADFGYDAYYVAKGEYRPPDAAYRNEGRHADSHTFGVRLLPRFTDTIRGEVELSGQVGSEIALAGQAYAGLTWEPRAPAKPHVTGAIWILSGDVDGERGDNAWHSVFSRETGLGESIAPMYTKYNYTNLVYPHLAGGCKVGDFSNFTTQAGPLFTAVKENDSDGSYRGLYVQVKYKIFPDKIFKCDMLNGGYFMLHGEYFSKGNYFIRGQDHSAFFGRLELGWDF